MGREEGRRGGRKEGRKEGRKGGREGKRRKERREGGRKEGRKEGREEGREKEGRRGGREEGRKGGREEEREKERERERVGGFHCRPRILNSPSYAQENELNWKCCIDLLCVQPSKVDLYIIHDLPITIFAKFYSCQFFQLYSTYTTHVHVCRFVIILSTL